MIKEGKMIDYNQGNYRRLRNTLKKILIDGIPAISWVNNANGKKIFINLLIYYSGDRFDEIKIGRILKRVKIITPFILIYFI